MTKSLASAVILIGLASPSYAAIELYDFIMLRDGVGAPGGIFGVDDLNDPNPLGKDYNFQTFCVEVSEYITFAPVQYQVGSIGITTKATNKTITDYTAWLYTSFLDNTLTSFNPTSLADANALQLAIWLSVGWDLTGPGPTIDDYITGSWITSTSTHLASKAWKPLGTGTGSFADSGWTAGDLNGVQVMNLYGLKNGQYIENAQDQLFRIPPTGGTPPVPEAASCMIWGLLAFCASFAAGRQRNG